MKKKTFNTIKTVTGLVLYAGISYGTSLILNQGLNTLGINGITSKGKIEKICVKLASMGIGGALTSACVKELDPTLEIIFGTIEKLAKIEGVTDEQWR